MDMSGARGGAEILLVLAKKCRTVFLTSVLARHSAAEVASDVEDTER